MTQNDFVNALKTECADAAVHDCLELLKAPPGRRPAQSLVSLSVWYRGLDPADQAHVAAALRIAADATLFGVLCVIDGVRVIEDQPAKSEFRLTATCNGSTSIISPGPEDLHDLLEGPAYMPCDPGR
ncbi:hypothetical protein LL973_07940 [Xanthomonas campestris pv. nigromaculans]|uniref:hypothetical protein n=1 Tax=Xanthomonas hortorum TaxID=56454 RepID=UPI001F1EC60F|nr:hypothetical protein [Xanthomonas hortorum]MCC4624249.1 hypothetical protein [Xanthomonas campestris pv. nigromaculans]